ncbi:MAG: amidase [Aquabacterium sp.]
MDHLLLQSATTIATALRRREVGAVELLKAQLARVDRLDRHINAVVVRDDARALQRAAQADDALARGECWGPLHGLPMTVKEAFDIPGLPTTWGFEAFRDNRPDKAAVTVQRLQDAGAVIFGKTNVPVALADWQSFNPVYGTTNNPWDLTRIPGGSSGGSAAALAAGMSALELGSDIGASIRNPAHYCGVWGHKPTWGVVPQAGHQLPGLEDADLVDIGAVGPMARSAADLALAMDVLASPLSAMTPLGRVPAQWRDDGRSPRQLRVAMVFDDAQAEVDHAIQDKLRLLADVLRRAGVAVTEDARPVDSEETHRVYVRMVRAATASLSDDASYADYLRHAAAVPPDADDFPARHWRGMTTDHRGWIQAHQTRARLGRQWAAFFQQHDLLICPIATSAAFAHNQTGWRWERMISVNGGLQPTTASLFWAGYTNLCGLPGTCFPLGLTPAGLPVGAQVCGPLYSDPMTIRFARWLEQEFCGFTPPPMAWAV